MDNQKQQLITRLKDANNILVTVSKNPSVDQLSAALGLTLALNKLKKHATAVFSGKSPSIIEFLEPEKTFEKNTDSLRDFIISLDRAKADKLRYKVEDTHVRIYISPYRTSIHKDDLEFSQGEANVDVVVALGVHEQVDLDQAIVAHGKILHDATIATVNAVEGGTVGSIDWVDASASGVSEMAAALSVELTSEKGIDDRIATALLTGIVSQTDRFSNEKTKPTTLSLASKLMEAGANQQLVSEKLQPPPPPPPPPPPSPEQPKTDTASTQLPEVPAYSASEVEAGQPKAPDVAQDAAEVQPPQEPEQIDDDGTLHIDHEEFETDEQNAENGAQIHIDNHGNFYPYDQGMMPESGAPPATALTPQAPAQQPVTSGDGLPPIIKKPQSAMLSEPPTTQREEESGFGDGKPDDNDEEFFDPLGVSSKRNERILQHNDGANEDHPSAVQQGVPSANAVPSDVAHASQATTDENQASKPLEGATRTLDDIERSVGAHQHAATQDAHTGDNRSSAASPSQPSTSTPPPELNDARQAIIDAMNTGSQDVQSSTPPQQQPQVQNPQQPPPVPPPMMPPQ